MTAVGLPDNRSNRHRANRARALDMPEGVPARYRAGESELALARSCGVSRGVVRRWLTEAGEPIRDRSRAGVVRAAKMTPAERREQAAAAHAAVRGTTWSPATNHARAETIERKAVAGLVHRSQGEIRLGQWLAEAGLHFVPEKAVAGYNLDFGISPVAVELLGGSWHGTGDRRAHHAKRTKAILDSGWSVVFVWSTHYMPLTRTGGQKVVALVKKARRNPPSPGQYWVVRGDGEVMSTGRADDDDFAVVLPTQRNLRRRAMN